MDDQDAPLLDINVDKAQPHSPAESSERRRKTSKQPPDGPKRRRDEEKVEKVKGKSKRKSGSKRGKRAVSDDDDEGGEDDDEEAMKGQEKECVGAVANSGENVEDENAMCVENEKPIYIEDEKPMCVEDEKPNHVQNEKPNGVENEKPHVENEKPNGVEGVKPKKAKGKEKSKAKTKAVSQSDQSGEQPLRDPSKSKKFHELFHTLPGQLREHWLGSNRDERTAFINGGVERNERGRLSINTDVMFKMVSTRREIQKGKELMNGHNYEAMGQNALVFCMDNSPIPNLRGHAFLQLKQQPPPPLTSPFP